MDHRKHHLRLSSLALTVAALCGMNGPASPGPTTHATVVASRSARATNAVARRQAPVGIRGSLYNASRMFAHAALNQRQRRQFNRQRHAAGDRKAFA